MAQYGIGLSALNAFSEAIDVTSNNIANGQTVGYKSAEYVFADQFFKAQNPQSRDRAGMGTSRMIIRRANTYGTISGTQNPLDLAIAGPGMFILAKQVDGTTPTENPQKFQYTRNGQFAVDANNRIVNENGLFLVGYAADDDGNVITNTKSTLKLDAEPLSQVPTQESTININIDNRKTSLAGRAFDPLEPESYSQSVAQTVYDAEGTSHILSLYYKKVNSADLILTDSGSTGTSLTFSVEQQIGTTLNGEQTNRLATTAVASSVSGSTQTLENISTTYVSGGIEEVDGVKTVTGLTSGNNQTNTVTFSGLSRTETISLGGQTLTASATMTAAQVATAWASQTVDAALGSFSTTNLTNWNATGLSGVDVTFVRTSTGADLSNSGTAGRAAVETAAATTAYLDGVYKNVALTGMTSGENSAKATVTVSGGVVTDISITETGADYTAGETLVGSFGDDDEQDVIVRINTQITTAVTGEGALGATSRVQLSDGTIMVLRQSSFDGATDTKYIVEVDRYAVFATLDGIAVGADTTGTGLTEITLDGETNDEQTSLGTMAFVAGKNLDSLARDAYDTPQFATKITINAGGTGNEGDDWGQTVNGGAVNFVLYSTDSTGYSSSAQTYTNDQDGSPTAQLQSYSFDSYGKLTALYDNGVSITKGQLILATFNNFEGLIPVGGNGFQASSASGDPLEDTPNGSQMGAIRAQAVEESNVDLTQQLVKLMVLQRAYSAASQATKVQVATLVDDTLRIGQ
jgi:flagellar hook-basal body protein